LKELGRPPDFFSGLFIAGRLREKEIQRQFKGPILSLNPEHEAEFLGQARRVRDQALKD